MISPGWILPWSVNTAAAPASSSCQIGTVQIAASGESSWMPVASTGPAVDNAMPRIAPAGNGDISWYCYRLPVEASFVRLFVPSGTRRLHASGSWSPDGVSIAALHPERSYVVRWWRGEGRSGFYVDAARSIAVRPSVVSYVDLNLDLTYDRGSWCLLDEDELSQASEEDTRLARRAIAEVRRLIAAGDPLFDASGDLWTIPADALRLKPAAGEATDLTAGAGCIARSTAVMDEIGDAPLAIATYSVKEH